MVSGLFPDQHGSSLVGVTWAGAHLDILELRQVASLETSAHEGIAEPADEGVAAGKGHAAEGQRRNERLAVALERVRKDADAGGEQREQSKALGARKLAGHGVQVRIIKRVSCGTGELQAVVLKPDVIYRAAYPLLVAGRRTQPTPQPQP